MANSTAMQPKDARWLANLNDFESTIASVGDALLARAAYSAGEHVLDIGCCGGATSLAIAEAVQPGGEVLGIDISPDLIAATTRRAAAAGIANARFVCADAASVTLPDSPYDRLFSRFGSMFFADPISAFANLRKLLDLGGRIDLAVWGPPQQNPWMLEGMAVARRHVELLAPLPRAPLAPIEEVSPILHHSPAGARYTHLSVLRQAFATM